MKSIPISITQDEITEFCQRHRVRKLSLFGSVLRDDFRPDSDVDVLVEFEPDTNITYFDMADMEVELQELVRRKIHLLTPLELSRYFRGRVMEMAFPLYERE